MESIRLIEKETIPFLSFKKNEVIENREAQRRRKINLERAMALGNISKRKVNIFFELKKGERSVVETTVWAVGQEYVTLKAGALIPIHSITKVKF